MMTSKERLHELVDQLPESDIQAAADYLEYRCAVADGADPMMWVLEHAPVVDDPLTPEEVAGLAEAREAIRAGRVVSAEEAKRLLLE